VSTHDLAILLSVDRQEWQREAALIPPFFETFGTRLPAELQGEYDALLKRLDSAVTRF
jgi:phosphoenolpyruvate carboxykinase (GTP)